MKKNLQNEPIAIPGAIMAVLVAALGLSVLFGVPLTPDQVGGIITLAGAVIGLVAAWQRKRVSPVSKSEPTHRGESRDASD